MKIVVTGGAGFIGSHVVDAYVSLGHHVLVVDDLSSGARGNLNDAAELVVCDIGSDAAARAVENFAPDIVNLHAAQIDVRKSVTHPLRDAQVNVVGCLNVVEAARRGGSIKRIVYAASGGSMYGDGADIPTAESARVSGASPYAVSKASFELYLEAFRRMHGLHYVALRYANVYGPRQNAHGEAGVVSIFCERLKAGLPCTIYGDGEQTRDFVYVGDVVRANVKALGTDYCGGVNIARQHETSVREVYSILAKAFGVSAEATYAPPRLGEQRRSMLAVALARQVLDLSADVSVNEGLQRTADWYRTQAQ
jgi:UDP-glucose 4-epimerase